MPINKNIQQMNKVSINKELIKLKIKNMLFKVKSKSSFYFILYYI